MLAEISLFHILFISVLLAPAQCRVVLNWCSASLCVCLPWLIPVSRTLLFEISFLGWSHPYYLGFVKDGDCQPHSRICILTSSTCKVLLKWCVCTVRLGKHHSSAHLRSSGLVFIYRYPFPILPTGRELLVVDHVSALIQTDLVSQHSLFHSCHLALAGRGCVGGRSEPLISACCVPGPVPRSLHIFSQGWGMIISAREDIGIFKVDESSFFPLWISFLKIEL